MAISLTTSQSKNNAVAGTSLAFTAFSSVATQVILLGVSILDTTKSVSSITDTAGSVYTFGYSVPTAGGTVRSELWYCSSVLANASNVITVNFSGATLASQAFGEYAGSTAIYGSAGISTSFGTSNNPGASFVTTGANDVVVGFFAVASSSGDSATAPIGTIRQSLFPALTTAGIVMSDNTYPVSGQNLLDVLLNTSRSWASVTASLSSGLPALVVGGPKYDAPNNPNRLGQHQKFTAPVTSQNVPTSVGNSGYVG